MMLILAQVIHAASESDAVDATGRAAALPPAYPAWPEQSMTRNVVPPPPPGPYMSTALTYSGQGFSCCPGGADGEQDQLAAQHPVKIDPLSSGMPWPERKRPVYQWLPENGEYNYAPGRLPEPEPAPAERYGNYPGAYPGGYPGGSAWQPMRYPPPRGYR